MADRTYSAINWNMVEDDFDSMVWEMLVEQFWVDTRIPVSKDLGDWEALSQDERDLFLYVFSGLTLLDTLQSESGIDHLKQDVRTKHEEAVLNNILFMESIHAKAYSSIFSTLATSNEIDKLFTWVENNPLVQKKANMIDDIYRNGTPAKKKIASVFLESFLFYSGFFVPFYYAGNTKMTNTGEVISLITKDESIHGYYIGYKFQRLFEEFSEDEQEEVKNWAYGFLYELYELETKYTKMMYEKLGLEDEVLAFLQYNANKALANLGFDPLFPNVEIDPVVFNGMSTSTSTHDFFSTVGNGYMVGRVEPMTDEDYAMYTK